MNYRTPFARGSRPFAGLVVLFALFMTSALQAEDRALVTRLVGLAKVQKAGQGDFKPFVSFNGPREEHMWPHN